MSPNTILLLQAIGITLQMINASLAVIIHSESIALLVGAVIGGYQFYIQHLGNKTNTSSSPKPPSE